MESEGLYSTYRAPYGATNSYASLVSEYTPGASPQSAYPTPHDTIPTCTNVPLYATTRGPPLSPEHESESGSPAHRFEEERLNPKNETHSSCE